MSDKFVASASPYEYLGSEKASVLKIFISSPKKPIRMDTQEQIIIASPNQRNEGSQDSGLENSTPEVSPPGAQTRAYWRTDSASPVSSADDSLANSRAKGENMTQRFASSKRSLAPSPPTEETVQSLSSLSLHSTPQFEQNTNANFLCRKDHSEAALCKAVVAQGALEEAFGTFKAVPSHKNGKFSSVRIEIEATRENHAKVAAVKTISTKETLRASGHFKPMCEMIDESLQKRQRNSYSAESSISPASSSRSSDFGGDNGSLDRMSFGSSNAGSGGDYKVVALDAKPQPGKLSEFVPEVERSKRDESYVVSSYGNMNNLPSTDTAVVRNWELSDEELLQSKSLTNNNEKSSNVGSPNEEIKHEPAYVPLAKTHELEFSDNIPKVVLPKVEKSGKKRSKSTDSQKSSKSGSTVGSYVSAASSQRPGSKTLSVNNQSHSDTDSVPSPIPVINISSEDEHTEIIKRVPEIGEYQAAHDSSSSIDEVLKAKYSPGEEETLHYAESNVQLDNIEEEEEQQYANINQDTLRSRSSRADSDYMETQSRKTGTEWATPREDDHFSDYRTPSQEPLFYDNAAKYGFDTSGGYHVPKQVYRRDVPIFVQEPRYHPQNVTHVGARWSPQPVQRYAEEDETQISRVTYRFYDRNMRELSSNTLIDRSRRATRSFEGGIEHYIEQLDTPYYPQTNSADRKFIRSQGYPTPFDARSKNYVNADSKFRILPKDENRSRPIVTKVQQNEASFHEESRQVHNNVRTPSGTPQKRQSINVMNERKPMEKVEKPQTMLTVSGKLRCGHCACELGRGSAMIIEALGLFYHINCFRCHVCDRALGSGSQTTDVRVRDGKLHCEKCYSNEEIGVQLSEI
uniref:LIM zinc-binding domain-containing protein n=1 Tax=Panagrolaimus sp. JU765 TaxID=591449 RepID=A0AC34QGY6_9BILA